jgi:hypothetical protein
MVRPIILALGVCLTACSTGSSPSTRPTPTENPAAEACLSGVNHANLHVQDVTALDFAIHDCSSMAMLEATLAAHPGYLNLDMTTVREFATNRCQDPAFLDVSHALVCQELGLP